MTVTGCTEEDGTPSPDQHFNPNHDNCDDDDDDDDDLELGGVIKVMNVLNL